MPLSLNDKAYNEAFHKSLDRVMNGEITKAQHEELTERLMQGHRDEVARIIEKRAISSF